MEDRAMKRIVLTAALLLLASTASGNTPDSTRFEHRISFGFRPAIPTRHHDFFRGANSSGKSFRGSGSAHLQYALRFPSSSRLGRIWPTAYQGIGISTHTFFRHSEIGTPTTLYIFQGAEIARLGENLSLDYEWNFGISTGWNTNNLVVGTKVNAYINTALLMSWHPRPEWTFSTGLDFTHFSNGDTTLPNVGVNTFGLRLSAVRSFGGKGVIHNERTLDTEQKLFRKRISLDLILCGAWNAETLKHMDKEYRLDGKFGILALHVNPLYSLTKNLLIGPSLDIQYNEGVNLSDYIAGISPVTDEIRFYRPPLAEQLAAGLSLRVELKMPIFSINLGLGHNIIYKGDELEGFYNMAILKTFITKSIFLHTGLKINYTTSSNNLLLGIGWRL